MSSRCRLKDIAIAATEQLEVPLSENPAKRTAEQVLQLSIEQMTFTFNINEEL